MFSFNEADFWGTKDIISEIKKLRKEVSELKDVVFKREETDEYIVAKYPTKKWEIDKHNYYLVYDYDNDEYDYYSHNAIKRIGDAYYSREDIEAMVEELNNNNNNNNKRR